MGVYWEQFVEVLLVAVLLFICKMMMMMSKVRGVPGVVGTRSRALCTQATVKQPIAFMLPDDATPTA